MSWGRDLWDQGNNIAAHTKKGIDFLERYASFVAERYKIENEYARQLKVLASKYTPKKRDAEDEQFTDRQAFIGVLGELSDMANQHERVAEQFQKEIITEIDDIAKKLRNERKENIDEALKLQNQLAMANEVMKKAQKEYCRAHKESEAAQAKFAKADQDINLSRADIAKAKNNSIAKMQQAEDAKTNYALQLQKTNEFQREYYTKLLPAVFERLREMDESRINEFSRLMVKCVEIEKGVLPIVQTCLDGMLKHATSTNATADSSAVVQRYVSGFAIPQDYPFVDLSVESSSTGSGGDAPGETTSDAGSGGGSTVNGSGGGGHYATTGTPTSPGGGGGAGHGRRGTERKQSGSGAGLNRAHSTKRGKFSNFFKSKTDEYVKEDFSDLPPQQQCNRLSKKIESIQKQIDTKLAQKEGLTKMQTVYRESPKLGDLSQVEAELHKCESEMSALEAELAKFQKYLKEANTHLNVPINAAAVQSGVGVSSNSTSPSSTPRSSVRGPPPSRPPPPTTSPSFHASSHYQQQQRSAALGANNENSAPIGRSGSENSVVSSSGSGVGDSNNKAKFTISRTTAPPHVTNGSSTGPSTSSSSSTPNVLSHGKGTTKSPPTSGSSRFINRFTPPRAVSAALAPADDYDEWLPADDNHNNGNGIKKEADSSSSSSPAVVLGTCKAMYDFAGDGDGMVSMKEGEEMLLLERDAGDGWTKIRKTNLAEGFVPTSYLDCKWYPAD